MASTTPPEPDPITQLQDCLDQLSTQFYASLRYLLSHAPPSPLPSMHPTALTTLFPTPQAPNAPNAPSSPNPNPAPPIPQNHSTQSNGPASSAIFSSVSSYPSTQVHVPEPATSTTTNPPTFTDPQDPFWQPLSSEAFQEAQKELARDLVAKQRQIEGLIGGLMDISAPGLEARQVERIRELEARVREGREEGRELEGMKEELVGRVEGALMGVRRV